MGGSVTLLLPTAMPSGQETVPENCPRPAAIPLQSGTGNMSPVLVISRAYGEVRCAGAGRSPSASGFGKRSASFLLPDGERFEAGRARGPLQVCRGERHRPPAARQRGMVSRGCPPLFPGIGAVAFSLGEPRPASPNRSSAMRMIVPRFPAAAVSAAPRRRSDRRLPSEDTPPAHIARQGQGYRERGVPTRVGNEPPPIPATARFPNEYGPAIPPRPRVRTIPGRALPGPHPAHPAADLPSAGFRRHVRPEQSPPLQPVGPMRARSCS